MELNFMLTKTWVKDDFYHFLFVRLMHLVVMLLFL